MNVVLVMCFLLAVSAAVTIKKPVSGSTKEPVSGSTKKPPEIAEKNVGLSRGLIQKFGKKLACVKFGKDPTKITSFGECLAKKIPDLKIQELQTCFPGNGTIGEKILRSCQDENDDKILKCLGPLAPSVIQYLHGTKDQNQEPFAGCGKILVQDGVAKAK